ncbi:MAG: Hint domain-containing protein [Boseongicola sp.]|nr:Hint domain-containing protein [Boseongicola sp.]NNJ66882.1 hypothetical protein [Boseongicola sp.]
MSNAEAGHTDSSVSGMMRVLGRIREGAAKPTAKSVAPVQPKKEQSADRWPLPGLAPMTRVRTSFGDVHAVALRKGDLVQTRTGEFKPIVWLNRVMLDAQFLDEKEDSNPIRIQAGAVGNATPACDVMVSPRQVVCGGAKPGAGQRREAGDLVERAGVKRQRETGLSYTMFHLGDAEEVYCDGIYLLFEPLHGANASA